MAMGKNTVNAIGAVAAASILAGAWFGAASPLLNQKKEAESQMVQAEAIGKGYSNKLSGFQGDKNRTIEEASRTIGNFQSLVSKSIDIESASRAIANSLPSGVTLSSFDFGSAQSVAKLKSAPMTIDGYSAPSEFSSTSKPKSAKAQNETDTVAEAGGSTETASGPKAVDPNAPITGFNRVPFTIKVTANSYDDLAKYLDKLKSQPRLMNVVSVDSSKTENVSATIYAFAFAGR